MLDFKGRHKWDAWNANKGASNPFTLQLLYSIGMSKAEAQEKYIALVEQIATEHS